jgi:hypothetical protein
MAIDINAELIAAGTKYRKELLAMPVAALSEMLAHMTLKTGIQGKEVGGELLTDAELRPYRTAKDATDNTSIVPYEWETFLGDVVKEFDPNAILGTLYTELTAKKPTDREIAKKVAMRMAEKVGEALYNNAFSAIRNASGNGTADLFNGFDTLSAAAVTAESLKTTKGNYVVFSDIISAANCGDVLKAYWRGSDKMLKRQKTKLMVPTSIRELYEDWYQAEYGSAPFNTDFKQRTLIGTEGKCELVALDNMEGGDYIYLTIRENMKIGVDQESDKETVKIRECDNPKMVQFFMMAYFGVGFDTLNKEFIKVGKLKLS